MTCSEGLQISNRFFAPEEYLTDRIQSPWLRCVVALPSGILKPFLFPVMAAVGTAALPIMAAVKREHAQAYLAAAGLSLLGLVGVGAFLVLSSTVLSSQLNVTVCLALGGVATSVTISLYRAIRGPLPKEMPSREPSPALA